MSWKVYKYLDYRNQPFLNIRKIDKLQVIKEFDSNSILQLKLQLYSFYQSRSTTVFCFRDEEGVFYHMSSKLLFECIKDLKEGKLEGSFKFVNRSGCLFIRKI